MSQVLAYGPYSTLSRIWGVSNVFGNDCLEAFCHLASASSTSSQLPCSRGVLPEDLLLPQA